MRIATLTALLWLVASALSGCAGGPPSAERDARRCEEAGRKPGSRAHADCTAALAAERERATRSVLNSIPIRGYGP